MDQIIMVEDDRMLRRASLLLWEKFARRGDVGSRCISSCRDEKSCSY